VGPTGQRRGTALARARLAAGRVTGPGMLGFGLRRGADGAGLRELGWLQSKAERASAGKKQSRPARGREGHSGNSRPSGRKEGGEESYSFLFQIFLQSKFKMQFQLNSKSDFKPSNSK